MSETRNHPSQERLHALAEEGLEAAERAVLESHLAACSRCALEVEELRSLFTALRELPRLRPSADFSDRVMARVRVRRPLLAWLAEWVDAWLPRIVPQTTRGWAVAAALFALPVVGVTALVSWLLAQPGVSAQGLWLMAVDLTGDALSSGWQWAWTRLAGSTLAASVAEWSALLDSIGRGEIGLAVVMIATLTAGSVYVLYQNLFRTNARRSENASFVF